VVVVVVDDTAAGREDTTSGAAALRPPARVVGVEVAAAAEGIAGAAVVRAVVRPEDHGAGLP